MKENVKLPRHLYLDASDIDWHINCHDGAKVAVSDNRDDIDNGDNTVVKYTQLSQLWHEPSERPRRNACQCLVEIGKTADDEIVYGVLECCDLGFKFGKDTIMSQGYGCWAYISDLLGTAKTNASDKWIYKSQFNISFVGNEAIVEYSTPKRGDYYEANLGDEAKELIDEVLRCASPSQSTMRKLRRMVLDSAFTIHRHSDGTSFDEA